jgi:hypothetical protein
VQRYAAVDLIEGLAVQSLILAEDLLGKFELAENPYFGSYD